VRTPATSIDDYIARFSPATQQALRAVRSVIAAAAPGAVETISYAIPTFDLGGRHLVHFAAFTRHLGLYPTAAGIAAFADELAPYKSSKGAVQFPLGEPLPLDLIGRIVAARVRQKEERRQERRRMHPPRRRDESRS
jgi:uncharacterized protein YdhG (YjbR/CyaY superfamily)